MTDLELEYHNTYEMSVNNCDMSTITGEYSKTPQGG